jgi:uncharacterized surface protein with fasciclin (FAS1) repeats
VRKQTLAAVLCVAALGLVVAGCGDDNDDEPAAATTTEMTTPAAASEDIVATAQATPDLSTLVAAVTAADLGSTLQGEGPYTVFAPTNDAFAEIQDTVDTLLKPENKDDLANVLKYHVVEGAVKAADLSDGQEITTVQGDKLPVSIDGDTVKVGEATVTQPDVMASNGVVHVIDKVLVPQS